MLFKEQIQKRIQQNILFNSLNFEKKIKLSDILVYENEEFIQQVYLSILGRKPDPEGLNYYLELRRQGVPKQWFIYTLSTCEEGKRKGTELLDIIKPKSLTELLELNGEDFVREVYQTILWREANIDDIAYNLHLLSQGQEKLLIISNIAYCPEAKKIPTTLEIIRQIQSFSEVVPINKAVKVSDLLHYEDEEFIQQVYLSILGRKPDPEGLNYYLELRRQGVPKQWFIYTLSTCEEGKRKGTELLDIIKPKSLTELLELNGEDFVREVYQTILWREANIDDIAYNVYLLSQGTEKVSIISNIASSFEAQKIPNILNILGEIKQIIQEISAKKSRLSKLKNPFKIIKKIKINLISILEIKSILFIFYDKFNEKFEKLIFKISSAEEERKIEKQNLFYQVNLFQEKLIAKIDSAKLEIKTREDKLYDQFRLIQESLIPKIDNTERKTEDFSRQLSLIQENLILKIDSIEQQIQTLVQNLDLQLNINQDNLIFKIETYIQEIHQKLHQQQESVVAIQIQQKRPFIYCGNNIILMRLDDFCLAIPAEDVRLVACLTFYGYLEPGLLKLLKKYTQFGMIVVDIGANIGTHSLIAAQKVGKEGKVYSFEPTPRVFELLKINIEINGYLEQIIPQQVAIADQKQISRFALKEILGHNTLFADEKDTQFIEVETYPLDEILGNDLKVDIIKVDTEGAEPIIWKGMKKTRERNPNIIIFMEFAPCHLQRAGVNPKEFIEEIMVEGFYFGRIDDITGEIQEISVNELLESISTNLILSKNQSFNY